MNSTIRGLFALTLVSIALGASAHRTHTPAAVHAHVSAVEVSRTVTVRMDDTMRFLPSTLEVKEGETVRIVLHNDGQLMHELVLGDADYLNELAAKVRRNPEMHHEGQNMVHVEAGETGEVVWTFDKAGRVDFACLLPGHFEAGMVGAVHVR